MKNTILLSFLLVTLFFLNGCAKKLKEVESPIDFQFVTVQKGETYESLAEKYTNSSQLAWRIKEFNKEPLKIGQQLIIPLSPFRPGGLRAQGYQLVPVLSYHNFSKYRSKNKLKVSAKAFREQLQYLKRNNYHIISIDQLIEYIGFGQVPEKSVLITIDDGWKATYDIAYPILKEFGYNATLFIPTQFIDSGHKLAISWQQLKEMVSDKTIDIQCHTKSHRDLSAFKKNETFEQYIKALDQDIVSSAEVIDIKLGQTVSALAYPFGKTNALVMALVKKNGYEVAFTVNRKSNPFYKHSFFLNRAMVFGTHSLSRFARDLKYFETDNFAKIEPIDSLPSLAILALSKPEEYENKNQWRTALLAWKMQRDKLISEKQIRASGKKYTKAELLSVNKLIQKSKQKILQITVRLNKIADQHFKEALPHLPNSSARKYLLQSLLFNPGNIAPLDLFQSNMGKTQPLTYQVKENDSLKSIARQLYNDPKQAVLIPIFNDDVIDDNSLVSGMELILPSTPFGIEKQSKVTSNCGVRVTKSLGKIANDYYAKANENFNHDQISKAIKNLKTALCLNPKHKDAKEMLDMLKDL